MESKAHPLKWYKDGLSFNCTGCGKCCSGSPGYVWVTLQEIEAIADYLNLSIEAFSKKYLKKVGHRFSLIEKNGRDFDCIFLKDKACQIYPHRPSQCKTYPFWPSILASKKNWDEEAKHCEGIEEKARTWSQEEIDLKQNEALE